MGATRSLRSKKRDKGDRAEKRLRMRKVSACNAYNVVLNRNDLVFCSWSTLDLLLKSTRFLGKLVISSMKLTALVMFCMHYVCF